MGKKPQPWKAPAADPDVQTDFFFAQDARDPRAQGQGPCEADHDEPLTPRASRLTCTVVYGANQSQRWCSCSRCGLRVGSWPKIGHTGKYNVTPNPGVVAKAISLQKNRGLPVSKQVMDALIKEVEAERSWKASVMTEKLDSSNHSSTASHTERPPAAAPATPVAHTPANTPRNPRSTAAATDCPDTLVTRHIVFESKPATIHQTATLAGLPSAYSLLITETSHTTATSKEQPGVQARCE